MSNDRPDMDVASGKLIAFEGLDGCGKTTQLGALESMLRARGASVLCTRQPTSHYREDPRVRAYLERGDGSIGMEELCILAAEDRRQHLATVIGPALERGAWVLCDRYVYSSYAFFRARRVDLAFVRRANEGVRIPDLTLLLDLSAEQARSRVLCREGKITKFEERRIEFMTLVRETFLECRDESFLVLDAGLSADVLSIRIAAEIQRRWGSIL
ncbi:dTMP kinase [Sorangium sp. So ce367]|uniref:dTMP kinase n=1 Tax=Sorangium sp. So ce367 TaxID=3133305 RepID=UPI003F630B67